MLFENIFKFTEHKKGNIYFNGNVETFNFKLQSILSTHKVHSSFRVPRNSVYILKYSHCNSIGLFELAK